jgi:hypothetical protein
MLHGAGCFALPAACALERVDRKKPLSDHVDDLFSIITLFAKVRRGAPDWFRDAGREKYPWRRKQDPELSVLDAERFSIKK